MKVKSLAGAVAASAVLASICTAPPALAINDVQVVGIEETSVDPNGSEIAFTVTKILPSGDPVAYPVAGQLYEASVMARAIRGTVVPIAPRFSARAESGANYPTLVSVSGLSGAALGEGATADGKIYFDVVGDVPTSVVYDNGPTDTLMWTQPVPGAPAAGGSDGGGGGSTGGGSTGGGGSEGVMGSTGPNDVSPQTSGGEIGGEEGGTEGGGGNLDSGGGSGAPNGDTGGGGSNG